MADLDRRVLSDTEVDRAYAVLAGTFLDTAKRLYKSYRTCCGRVFDNGSLRWRELTKRQRLPWLAAAIAAMNED